LLLALLLALFDTDDEDGVVGGNTPPQRLLVDDGTADGIVTVAEVDIVSCGGCCDAAVDGTD